MANNPGSFRPGGYTAYDPNTQWQVSGPIATGTYNPDWNKTAAPDTSATDAAKIAADSQAAADRAAAERQAQQQQYERDTRQRQTLEVVKAAFAQYGLSSLYSKIEEYARADYSADMIAILLRQTPEYKQRFPAMEAMAKEGRAISEAAYIDYERTAVALEQRYGLPKGMLMGNVTELLTKNVSANELNDRVILASAASTTAPDELKRAMKDYYGVDQGGLAAYYLDPDLALPLLEKQYATAQIGGASYQQGLSTDLNTAAQLQEMGVSEDQARQGFGNVRDSMGLTTGKGDSVSQSDLTLGTFGKADAAQQIQRVAKGRVNKFAGGGGYQSDRQGVGGLGSSG
jgi:hypothetical protein